jgi:hypothetical protein
MAVMPSTGRPNPLQAALPSPTLVFHYPLFATNVRTLCEKDGWTRASAGSLVTTIRAVRITYSTEGAVDGLYRGFPMFLAHSGIREMLRWLANRFWNALGFTSRSAIQDKDGSKSEDSAKATTEEREAGSVYWVKASTKYLIDVACYPMLLVSTRNIIMRKADPRTMLQRVSEWKAADGALSMFNGLTAHLCSMVLDDIMDAILMVCIDRCSEGMERELELADKFLLKTCGASVVSVFTGLINHIGVIQRCQSVLTELIPFTPISKTISGLPWKGTFYQFLIFSGIFALNVRLISMKMEAQMQDEEYYAEDQQVPRPPRFQGTE